MTRTRIFSSIVREIDPGFEQSRREEPTYDFSGRGGRQFTQDSYRDPLYWPRHNPEQLYLTTETGTYITSCNGSFIMADNPDNPSTADPVVAGECERPPYWPYRLTW